MLYLFYEEIMTARRAIITDIEKANLSHRVAHTVSSLDKSGHIVSRDNVQHQQVTSPEETESVSVQQETVVAPELQFVQESVTVQFQPEPPALINETLVEDRNVDETTPTVPVTITTDEKSTSLVVEDNEELASNPKKRISRKKIKISEQDSF
jgi:hypothetical protein